MLYLHIDGLTVPEYGGELSINVTGMEPTQVSATDYPLAAKETFYLPIVSVTAPGFNSVTPTVSGKFTDLKSNVTDLGSSGSFTLYNQDYESAIDASSWTNGEGTLELVTGDATYGKYIHHNVYNTDRNRSAYTLFGNMDFTDVSQYNIQFDTRITAGNMAERSETDFVVMTNDATVPTDVNIGFNFSERNGTRSNYLFRLKAANSQVFTINDGTEMITLDASKWYHVKLLVDVETKTVGYNISQGNASVASGTFTVPTSSCLPKGLFILDGRGSGDSKFDNINVYYTKDFSSYTFTEPGTLTLKASVPGYKSKTETFTVPAVYYKYYESPDYNQIQAADATSVLGSDYWKEGTTTSRWGNWSMTNGTYGENYVMGPQESRLAVISTRIRYYR